MYESKVNFPIVVTSKALIIKRELCIDLRYTCHCNMQVDISEWGENRDSILIIKGHLWNIYDKARELSRQQTGETNNTHTHTSSLNEPQQ